MEDSEDDVLASMAFPAQHRTKLHSVNTLERLNKEVKRRADVVGRRGSAPTPSEASIIRLIGAVLLEANDAWQMQHPTMGVEAMGEMLNPPPTDETLHLPPKAASSLATSSPAALSTTLTDVTASTGRLNSGLQDFTGLPEDTPAVLYECPSLPGGDSRIGCGDQPAPTAPWAGRDWLNCV
jgi:hypothetical protein